MTEYKYRLVIGPKGRETVATLVTTREVREGDQVTATGTNQNGFPFPVTGRVQEVLEKEELG